MKIRLFRAHTAQASAVAPKPASPWAEPRPVIVQPPPRMYSLLLPPAYRNDRR